MEEGIVRYRRDVWGEEVILGVSWDLLWVVAVAVLVLLAAHAVVMAVLVNRKMDKPSADGRRVLRHESIDRWFHWIMAVSIIVLIFTGVAPIIGLRIAWLEIHWISGLILTFVVVFHIVRSLFWQDFKSMILGPRDFGEPFDSAKKPGKYSFEQKGMHWAVTVVALTVIVTGVLMFMQIDTPFWDRTNSMPEDQLGLVFLLHGLSTLALVAPGGDTYVFRPAAGEDFLYPVDVDRLDLRRRNGGEPRHHALDTERSRLIAGGAEQSGVSRGIHAARPEQRRFAPSGTPSPDIPSGRNTLEELRFSPAAPTGYCPQPQGLPCEQSRRRY